MQCQGDTGRGPKVSKTNFEVIIKTDPPITMPLFTYSVESLCIRIFKSSKPYQPTA